MLIYKDIFNFERLNNELLERFDIKFININESETIIQTFNNNNYKEIESFIDANLELLKTEIIKTPKIEEVVKEQENKISILEEENELLKLELSITQDAVNELLFNTLNA